MYSALRSGQGVLSPRHYLSYRQIETKILPVLLVSSSVLGTIGAIDRNKTVPGITGPNGEADTSSSDVQQQGVKFWRTKKTEHKVTPPTLHGVFQAPLHHTASVLVCALRFLSPPFPLFTAV